MNILIMKTARSLTFAALAGALSLPFAQADFTLVDDFQSYSDGAVRDFSTPWTSHGGSGFTEFVSDGANRFIANGWFTDFRTASRPLPVSTEINPGDQATVFFQFRAGPFGDAWVGGAQFGLASNPATGSATPFGDFRVQTTVNPSPTPNRNNFVVRDGENFITLTTLEDGAWYNVWYVIDRTDGDSFEIYLTPGANITATASDRLSYLNGEGETVSSFAFRSGGSTADVLDSFMLIGRTLPNVSSRIDNIWIDNTGSNFEFKGTDFLGWQQDFSLVTADPEFSADFGTDTGKVHELNLLRNRPQDLALQANTLRYVPTSTVFSSSLALAGVENYLPRQNFTVETELTLQNWLDFGPNRIGLVVLGNHAAFEDPINTTADNRYYSLVWFPEVREGESIIQISEGLRGVPGSVFAFATWEGVHPWKDGNPNAGIATATPFRLTAEGVYSAAGDLSLSFTLADPDGFSQTITAQIANPHSGNFFGLAGRSQSSTTPQAIPVFDFNNLNITLGDEPGEILPDPAIEAPFSLAFGSGDGLDAGENFSLGTPDDWSLEAAALRLSATTADYQNELATSRVTNFSPGTDFFLRSQVTVPSLSGGESDNRVGMVLFGDADRTVFDSANDSTYLTFQWLPTSPAGGSLVVRHGMNGTEIARTDLAEQADAPVFAAGGTYNLYFEGRYDAEGDLQFAAYLLDTDQREAAVTGLIANPPTGNRFGFGARHRTTEAAVWDFHRFNWSNSSVLRGDIVTLTATTGQNPGGTAANAIGKRRSGLPEFTWITNPIVGTNGGEAERQTNAFFLLFALPERPNGATIRGANLSLTRQDRTRNPGAGNVDVWGVGFQEGLELSSDFWHAGDTDEGPAAGIPAPIKLHDDLVTAATPTTQAVFTTQGPEFDLADFLNHLYDNGAQPGDYAMIRLSYDDPNLDLGVLRYEFSAPGTSSGPSINLTMSGGTAAERIVFANWQAAEFPDDLDNLEVSGLLANPAGDGVTNLLKYASGLPPLVPATTQDLAWAMREGTGLTLTYYERTDADDLTYLVEVSENLIDWHSGAEHTEEVNRSDESPIQTVTIRALSNNPERLFMRVVVQVQ